MPLGVDSLRSPFGRTACVCRRYAPRREPVTSTFAESRSIPLSYSRVEKSGGRVARPPGAESGLDVHQSIQQSVETTHDR